jgi:hypothetical protein
MIFFESDNFTPSFIKKPGWYFCLIFLGEFIYTVKCSNAFFLIFIFNPEKL